MPRELILRLRVDPATGRRELVVDYTSDADALPVEHEDEHRALAGKLVDGGLRDARVEVSRAAEQPADAPAESAADAEREAPKLPR